MTAPLRAGGPVWAALAFGAALACSGQTFTSSQSASSGASGGLDAGGTGGTSGTSSGGSESGGASGSSSGGAGAGMGGAATGGLAGTGGAAAGGLGGTGGILSGGAPGTGGKATGGAAGSGGVATGGSPDSGGASSGGTTAGGDAAAYVCSGAMSFSATVEKTCTNDSNCVLVKHIRDCCGTELLMGISHAAVANFDAAEAYCDAALPKCGCAPSGVFAEDGTMVPLGGEQLIAVNCQNGTCMSHYNGNTFKCGDKTCTAQEYCQSSTLLQTTYSCMSLDSSCNSCTCISTPLGCTCGQTQGHFQLTCIAT